MMKKLITLSFFTLALFLTTTTTNAQNKMEINQAAFEKTEALRKLVKFDTNVQDDVYQAYRLYELKMYNINTLAENGTSVTAEDKTKVKANLTQKLKELFTEEQFDVYQSLQD